MIFGVANKRSLAWAIAQSCAREGADLAFTYQIDRLKSNVEALAATVNSSRIFACDAVEQEQIQSVMDQIDQEWGQLDFLIHAIAFAKSEELEGEYIKTSADGFQLALNVSAYTLTSIARTARPLLAKSEKGSIVTLTYLGGERVMPGYNVMGVAKSALEMSVRYLANDLGPEKIRVNGISAGPVSTLAARGIRGFTEILKHVQEKAPLRRNIDASEVGDAAAFLCSDLSRAVTGEILHVDAGYNILAWYSTSFFINSHDPSNK